jgi:uncharacterized protein YlzI (FlbEa/FlbD family)
MCSRDLPTFQVAGTIEVIHHTQLKFVNGKKMIRGKKVITVINFKNVRKKIQIVISHNKFE